jgi:hypothetical protein
VSLTTEVFMLQNVRITPLKSIYLEINKKI